MRTEKTLGQKQNRFQEDNEARCGWMRAAWNVLPGGLLLCAATLTAVKGLDFPGYVLWSLAPGLAVFVLAQLEGVPGKRFRMGALAISAALLLLIGMRQKDLQQGFLISVNHLLDKMAEVYRFYPQLYEVEASGQIKSLLSFWSAALVLLAAAQAWLFKWIPLFLRLTLAFILMVWGAKDGYGPGVCLTFLAALLLWQQGKIRQKGIPWVGGDRIRAWLQGAGLLTLAALAVGGGCLFLKSLSGVSPESWMESVREAAADKVRQARYEKEPVDSLPEGRLTGLGQWTSTDGTALEVVMEEPQSVYLRGFVGSVYTQKGWGELAADVYLEKQELFYWLHQSEFYGLGQLSLLNRLAGEDGQKSRVTVQNLHADSRYLYLPYEVNTPLEEFEKASSLGDESVSSRGLRGTRVYQFTMDKNLIKEYPDLAAAFYEGSEDLQSYEEAESYYNAFVYAHYLDVPQSALAVLQAQLPESRDQGDAHASYEEANAIVMGYLDQQITYEENPAAYSGKEEFLKWFLESEQKGYAVHYATAATLMYRYLGIPARYVEGYLITPEMVKDVPAYQPIQVTGENAHAWVEIYQDGVGWIPMEVTPCYRDVMERPEYALASAQESGQEAEGGAQAMEEEQIRDEQTEPKKEETGKKQSFPIKVFLQAIGLGILLAFGIWLLAREIRGRNRVKKRRLDFQNPDLNRAVTQIYAYILLLFRKEGISFAGGSHYGYGAGIRMRFGTEAAEEFLQILPLVQKGIYSADCVTQEQKARVEAYKDWILEEILRGKRIWQKLWMYWGSFVI